MEDERVPINRLTGLRFLREVKSFTTSAVGGRARLMLAALVLLLFGVNGLNVVGSYVNRDFFTALANRNWPEFISRTVLYVGVFTAATIVAVIYRFTEERLALLWREWLSRRLIRHYLDGRVYYELKERGELDNPDQRLAEDTRAFSATTLSFSLILLNATFTIVAFSGVMWSISPRLFLVAVLYAAIGSILTIALGRPLVRLSYDQSDREAHFRADLIHVRENAESVALSHREANLSARLLRRLDALVANMKRIIAVNRRVGYFTTEYNYLIQIIPALVVAPLFFRGEVEFGVITQSGIAFGHLVGAFSVIITQFQSISSYAAVLARVTGLVEAVEQAAAPGSPIEIHEAEDRVVYEHLTLRAPGGRILVHDLSVAMPSGKRVLVVGESQTALLALFRATAGMWEGGEGRIRRPGHDGIMFLPERPYLPPGTLRELLLRFGEKQGISDEKIIATLHDLDLEPVLLRVGGLDVERDWENILSLGEQQLVAVARLVLAAPRFAFLDRITTTVAPEAMEWVLKIFAENSITHVTFGEFHGLRVQYDAVLELATDGTWTWTPVGRGQAPK